MEATFELPIQSPTDGGMDGRDRNALPPARRRDAPSATYIGFPRQSFGITAPEVRIQQGEMPPASKPKPEAAGLARGKGSLRDAKLKRPSDRHASRPGARLKKRITSSNATPKPLLPVTERRSQEDNKSDRRALTDGGESEKGDVAPDGSSAGRGGRQFIVSNVGNNGRIYLK